MAISLAAETLRDIIPSGCRGKPAMNKHRMNKELSRFAARLRGCISSEGRVPRGPDLKIRNGDSYNSSLRDFDSLALELFALQFTNNAAYRRICEARGLTPDRKSTRLNSSHLG